VRGVESIGKDGRTSVVGSADVGEGREKMRGIVVQRKWRGLSLRARSLGCIALLTRGNVTERYCVVSGWLDEWYIAWANSLVFISCLKTSF
jgi:hypothetical protein